MSLQALSLEPIRTGVTHALPDPRLDDMRRTAMDSRLERRPNPEMLCALRHQDEALPGNAHLSALIRLLPIALDKRMVFHRPGVPDRTFDESWLLRLISATEQRDEHSLTFALASRVPKHFHAPIRFLARGYAESFTQAS
ncbi:MAG: hypothetical protein AAF415_08375 [Pseudomonadota bacterium]